MSGTRSRAVGCVTSGEPTKTGTYAAVLNCLHGRDMSAFTCGGATPEQWNAGEAERTVNALIQLWNDW